MKLLSLSSLPQKHRERAGSSHLKPSGLKMSRKMRSVYVALLLTLTSLHAARRSLNSINDLITCLQSEQTNILELLHWFACAVEIDRDNVIRLTFDPSSGAYGSHRYRNREGLLESLPWYQYYTIGNIHQPTSATIPSYVVDSPRRNTFWNSARILIGVYEGGAEAGEIIDQVYITQHYDTSENQGSSYDPDHTYRITTNFLRQLKKLSINEIQRLAHGSQTVSFTNTSVAHSQKVNYPKQDTHIDMGMVDSSTSPYDCLRNHMSIACCVVLFLLIIVVVFGSYFGYSRK